MRVALPGSGRAPTSSNHRPATEMLAEVSVVQVGAVSQAAHSAMSALMSAMGRAPYCV